MSRMSFPDSKSLFVPPGFGTSSNEFTINAWPQYPVVSNQGYDHNNTQFSQPHSLKRHREDENQSDTNFMPQRIVPSSGARINTGGINNIFYKTRVCAKFKLGLCLNGEMCKFAHGAEDLRQAPPNWQELVNGRMGEDRGLGNRDDEQRIALKMKLCKNFSNGEVCPYGDKCNFLHDDPKRYRADSARVRDNSISLNAASGHVSGLDQTDANLGNAGSDAYIMKVGTEHWKPKLCSNFESSGFLSSGDKRGLAHGIADLQGFIGRAEGNLSNFEPLAKPMKPIIGMPNHLVSSTMYTTVSTEKQLLKKDFSKLKGSKKINRIYGDWIDDIPLDAPQS